MSIMFSKEGKLDHQRPIEQLSTPVFFNTFLPSQAI